MSSTETECVEHKHCLTCGYILDNLTEDRCPECGRKFNLRIPTTFRLGEEKLLYARWKPYLRWAILASLIPWLGIAIVTSVKPGYSGPRGASFLVLIIPLWMLMMNEFFPFCMRQALNAPKAQVFVRLPAMPLMNFSASSRPGKAAIIAVQVAAAGLLLVIAMSAFVLIFLI